MVDRSDYLYYFIKQVSTQCPAFAENLHLLHTMIQEKQRNIIALQQLSGTTPVKIAVSTSTGAIFIAHDEIIYVESDNNYSRLLLSYKRSCIVSRSLKEIQDILGDSHFFRIHRQYIVNLNHVKQLHRNDGTITMDTGEHLPIARNQKEMFAGKYKWL